MLHLSSNKSNPVSLLYASNTCLSTNPNKNIGTHTKLNYFKKNKIKKKSIDVTKLFLSNFIHFV